MTTADETDARVGAIRTARDLLAYLDHDAGDLVTVADWLLTGGRARRDRVLHDDVGPDAPPYPAVPGPDARWTPPYPG